MIEKIPVETKNYLYNLFNKGENIQLVREIQCVFSNFTFDYWILILDELVRQGSNRRLFNQSFTLPKYPHQYIYDSVLDSGGTSVNKVQILGNKLVDLISRRPELAKILLDLVFGDIKSLPIHLEHYRFTAYCDYCSRRIDVPKDDIELVKSQSGLNLPNLICPGCQNSMKLIKRYELPKNSIPTTNNTASWRKFLTIHFSMAELVELAGQLKLNLTEDNLKAERIDELLNFLLIKVKRLDMWHSLRNAVFKFEFKDPFPELVNVRCGYCGTISQARLNSSGAIVVPGDGEMKCRSCQNSANFFIVILNREAE